jgi:tRNA U34 2-thiouridine synthase MnmA/TrmU
VRPPARTKFKALLRHMGSLGCQLLATGHYARIRRGASGPVQLLRGVDTHKGALSLSLSLLLSISPAHAPLGRSFGRGS